MNTHDKIINETSKLFAQYGNDGVSISNIAKHAGIAKSVIYHYFSDKDILLTSMFHTLNSNLGIKRSALPKVSCATEMLNQVIHFQFTHAEEIIAVLKYYAAFRAHFQKKQNGGYVPLKAYLHVEEVLHLGVNTKEFVVRDIKKDSKIITHAINGFILEYYPHIPIDEERSELVADISNFILRALINNSTNRKEVN